MHWPVSFSEVRRPPSPQVRMTSLAFATRSVHRRWRAAVRSNCVVSARVCCRTRALRTPIHRKASRQMPAATPSAVTARAGVHHDGTATTSMASGPLADHDHRRRRAHRVVEDGADAGDVDGAACAQFGQRPVRRPVVDVDEDGGAAAVHLQGLEAGPLAVLRERAAHLHELVRRSCPPSPRPPASAGVAARLAGSAFVDHRRRDQRRAEERAGKPGDVHDGAGLDVHGARHLEGQRAGARPGCARCACLPIDRRVAQQHRAARADAVRGRMRRRQLADLADRATAGDRRARPGAASARPPRSRSAPGSARRSRCPAGVRSSTRTPRICSSASTSAAASGALAGAATMTVASSTTTRRSRPAGDGTTS